MLYSRQIGDYVTLDEAGGYCRYTTDKLGRIRKPRRASQNCDANVTVKANSWACRRFPPTWPPAHSNCRYRSALLRQLSREPFAQLRYTPRSIYWSCRARGRRISPAFLRWNRDLSRLPG